MNSVIKKAIEDGRLVILLGAGASSGGFNSRGDKIPASYELAGLLAEKIGINLDDGDDLSDVYAAAKSTLGTDVLIRFMEDKFKHCKPSSEYAELAKFPFPRIYTFNIDDSFERSVASDSVFKFNVRRRNSRVEDFDTFYSTIDYIKLNGDINNPEDGFIFSPSEYAEGTVQEPVWYQELAKDFHRFTFLFIGTKLKEPLFQYQIEKYRNRTKEQSGKSYLLVPSLTAAQKARFLDTNIEHLDGGLSDFILWLKSTFPNRLSSRDVLSKVRPELNVFDLSGSVNPLFDCVTAVSRSALSLIDNDETVGNIKSFYKGFKPTWSDILKSIPAELEKTNALFGEILSEYGSGVQFYLIKGSAGCGKTTALKQIALKVSEVLDCNVYYIDGVVENLESLIRSLNSRNESKYFVFVERLADMAEAFSSLLSMASISEKIVLVAAENSRIWNYRGCEHFVDIDKHVVDFSSISHADVDPILDKIEIYGNWTRLGSMSQKNRRIEIIKKSKSQLLIGLMEATSGEGYSAIIRKDFESLSDDSEKALLLLSGLAALQRSESSEATLVRALSYLGLSPDVHGLSKNMPGLVSYHNGQVATRHRLYIEKIVELFASMSSLKNIIKAYIHSFTVYQFPVVKNVSSKEAAIYKGLVNFKFLKKVLKDKQEDIIGLYSSFEKAFEREGLFLLQYGLALRAYNYHEDALEKLVQAREAFPESVHIEHAYAQQLLILADRAEDSHNSEVYLHRAIDILRSIDKINKREGDRYPLISLSEGHVKILHKFGRITESRLLARNYFEELKTKFGLNHGIDRITKTQDMLMRYSTTGVLKNASLEY